MDVYNLKQIILDNDKIECILEDLNMHHISDKGEYWSCGMPDGDNPASTNIYKNEYLRTIAYTRDIGDGREVTDLLDLIQFMKKIPFFKALSYVCTLLDIDYYGEEDVEVPKSLLFLQEIEDMNSGMEDKEVEYKTKIRDKAILTYYLPYLNMLFKNDNISFATQKEFGIGYDDVSNRITIPIYNELGDLIGVKGRRFDVPTSSIQTSSETKEDMGYKYLYLERCNKSHVLYGLYKTYNHIIQNKLVYVGESEKFVMQLWSAGFYNAVALGGHKISKYQLILLQRMGVDVCLCFDKDIIYRDESGDKHDDIETECKKFESWVNVYYLLDKDNLLNEKESPSDSIDKFEKLIKNNKYRYIGE